MSQHPVVAQIHRRYLGLSENFIHRLVGKLTRWQAIVLTQEAQNGDYYRFGSQYQVLELGRDMELPFQAWSKLVRLVRPSVGAYYALQARYSKELHRTGASVLHAHFGSTGWTALPLKRLHQLPLVVSFHGRDASALLRQDVWYERYQELFEIADAFTVPSNLMASRLEESGCPRHKLHVLHYGVDLAQWSFQLAPQPVESKTFEVLMVCRLVEKKGVTDALQAILEVQQTIPEVRLRIAGDGELRLQIEQTIREHGLESRVSLLGFVDNSQVQELMRASDVLLAPSVTAADGDEEGLPNVLIESAAVGLPIIATNHAGAPELIQDGVSGFLVPERDSRALADRLIAMAKQPAMRLNFSSSARRIIEQEFDLLSSVAQLESIYDRVVSDG